MRQTHICSTAVQAATVRRLACGCNNPVAMSKNAAVSYRWSMANHPQQEVVGLLLLLRTSGSLTISLGSGE